ncbi:VTT domain-containing protein [Ornithinibacillus massiliensis]|uniref:TVP38/TMEM64 family membrane protein n=1 Tax=Ornithinibacillus massiliensis TaxID=1944633 RepID=A0ABS5MGP0_9BACI|nr:VTT domain-containing protein [Ornithinibacillus massiliensis]MBS3681320.1 TVP38/TMEM64 family protein [Ornithinibacillus massiliensis]
MEKPRMRKLINILTIIFTIAAIAFLIYGLKTDIFYSEHALVDFVSQFGIWAPLVFIIFQAIQVIIPVIPGGLGLLAGVLLFGTTMGFVYNYVSICLGSIIAFLIAKQYGQSVIKVLFSKKMQEKYSNVTEHKNFTKYFAIAIFLPLAPDDFLCYLAGTTKMKLRHFTIIILLGKPFAIAMYTFGLDFIMRKLSILI